MVTKTPKPFEKMSKRDQVSDIAARASDLVGDAETLKDSLETWLEGMPSGMQNGDKAGAIQEVIDNLDTLVDALNEASGLEAQW
jgi:ABC-type transporter Mla subunit MlaD